MTTLERIAEIEARLKAATPGKWVTGESPACTPNNSCLSVWAHDKKFYEHKIVECVLVADATLIAHAPADLAWLTASLRETLESLESIASKHKPRHETEEYWQTLSHERCATVLATDTKIARTTLASIAAKAGE